MSFCCMLFYCMSFSCISFYCTLFCVCDSVVCDAVVCHSVYVILRYVILMYNILMRAILYVILLLVTRHNVTAPIIIVLNPATLIVAPWQLDVCPPRSVCRPKSRSPSCRSASWKSYKTFFLSVTDAPGKPFQPSLMFVGKARGLP
jgi:hypothetical protein